LLKKKRSLATAKRPLLPERIWRHLLTHFVFAKYQPKNCSTLVLLQNRLLPRSSSVSSTNDNSTSVPPPPPLPQFASSAALSSFPSVTEWWSDEQACDLYKLFIDLTAQCSRTHPLSDMLERTDFAYLNEYLILGLLAVAAENELGDITWQT